VEGRVERRINERVFRIRMTRSQSARAAAYEVDVRKNSRRLQARMGTSSEMLCEFSFAATRTSDRGIVVGSLLGRRNNGLSL